MEEPINIIVYGGAGIALAAFIIVMLINWEVDTDVETINAAFQDGHEPDQIFTKVDVGGFAFQAHQFWQNCKSNDTLRLYVDANEGSPSGTLNKQSLFEIYISLQWCRSIQSKEQGCGEREDVQVGNLSLPRIVELRCYNNSLMVS